MGEYDEGALRAVNSDQGTGNREPGTGNWEQGLGT